MNDNSKLLFSKMTNNSMSLNNISMMVGGIHGFLCHCIIDQNE